MHVYSFVKHNYANYLNYFSKILYIMQGWTFWTNKCRIVYAQDIYGTNSSGASIKKPPFHGGKAAFLMVFVCKHNGMHCIYIVFWLQMKSKFTSHFTQ